MANTKSKQKEKEYFRIYYNLGSDRSIKKLWQELGKSMGKSAPSEVWLEKLSSTYKWQKRIVAWDKQKGKRLDQEVIEKAVISDEQMLKITSAALATFAKRLKGKPMIDKEGDPVLDDKKQPIYIYSAQLSAFEAKVMWDIQQEILRHRPLAQINVFQTVIINQTIEEIQALPEEIKNEIIKLLTKVKELYETAYDGKSASRPEES